MSHRNTLPPHLSLFTEDTAASSGETVAVPLATVLQWLEDARQSDRTWLRDFTDDEVMIPADLHDVLRAYSELRKSA